MKTRIDTLTPFITRDGSEIRELMHPAVHASLGVRNQSLAQARVAPGERTVRHCHHESEEIYHISAGSGRMQCDDNWFSIQPGDSICIPPGMPHRLENTGDSILIVLCCCSPPYSHQDTELLEADEAADER